MKVVEEPLGDLLGLAGIVRVPTDEVQIVHSGGVELLLLLLLLLPITPLRVLPLPNIHCVFLILSFPLFMSLFIASVSK